MDSTMKRHVLALAAEGHSQRAIAEGLGLSRGAVWRALRADRSDVAAAPIAAKRLDEEPPGLLGAGWVSVIGLGILILVAILRGRQQAPRGPSDSEARS